MGPIDLATASWLGSPAGQQALLQPDLAPSGAERAAAFTQAELRQLATHRYGIDAHDLLLTRDGLEQATRPEVSQARIRMLGLPSGSAVLDATAGLGLDTRAFLAAGMQVTAVERDPAIAQLLGANAPAARVICGDITDDQVLAEAVAGIGPADLVFIDPARRGSTRSVDGSRARPERDPQRWSPPWSFVEGLAERFRVCAKVAPGFPPTRVPAGWQAAWIATPTGPVETCLISWPALGSARRACVVTPGTIDAIDDDAGHNELGDDQSDAHPLDDYLHEPARIVVHAGLVDALARGSGLTRLDPDTHWLTSASPIDPTRSTRLLSSYRVLAELPTAPKALRAALRARGVANVTIKSRGARLDAQAWRERLRLPEGPQATLAIWQTGSGARVILVEAVHS